MPVKPDLMRYPSLFIVVVPVHSVAYDVAVVNCHNALREGVHKLLFVRDDQDRRAQLVYLLKQEHQLQAAHGVEVAGRLVRYYHARAVHQGAGYGHTLLLAAGQLLRVALLAALQADQLKDVGHALLYVPVRRADDTHRKGDVVVHRHLVDETEILENDAQRPAQLRQPPALYAAHIEAVDGYLARLRLDLSGDELDDSGLARSGRPDQENEFRLVDLEIYAVERLGAAAVVNHRDVVHLNHRLRSSVCPRRSVLGCILRVEVFFDHHGDLEHYGVVKLAQVQAGDLFYLLKPVHQGVAVDVQLAACLRYVQVVLKELVYRLQRVRIQGLDGVLLEDLGEEHLAQGGRQLVDDAANAEILVVDDGLLSVEDLADLDGDLGFLIPVGQLAQVVGRRADADDGLHQQLAPDGVFDVLGYGDDILRALLTGELLNDDDIRLAHRQDKIPLPVREEVLDNFQRRDVGTVQLADQIHGARHVGHKVQLLGPDIHVAGQDIVGNDVLDERSLVVLLLVIRSGLVHGHGGEDAYAARGGVMPRDKHGVVKARTGHAEQLICSDG